jgi:hypothetical protein
VLLPGFQKGRDNLKPKEKAGSSFGQKRAICVVQAGLKVCILGKACLAPIQPILVAQVTILGANIYFGVEQINIFRSTVLLENIF